MSVLKRATLAAGLAACVGGVLLATSAAPAPDKQPPPVAAAHASGFAGSASCSARACHGGDEPVKDDKAVAQQNEYTQWVMYDKHARAYGVLESPRAKQMAENLRATNKNNELIHAHEDARCLACHATPESAWGLEPGKKPSLEAVNWQKGGVSCEACHGPANKPGKPWFSVHTSEKDWRKLLEPKQKSAFGFTDLTDLTTLAKTCAGCHVGAPEDKEKKIPARDCNHDIMGAGHPRLNFELSSFMANMPPHWNVKLKTESAAKDAKTWLVGRTVSAKAALDLLADRAERAKSNKAPWPELAEYRCYSCHTGLSNDWAKIRNEGSRPKGTLPYDTWYSSLLPLADPALADGYSKLTAAMTRAEPGDVADQAKKLSESLNGLLTKDGSQVLKDAIGKANDSLGKTDADAFPRTWEDATQLTLALAALKMSEYRSTKSLPADLTKVIDALRFPAKGEGPKGADGPALDNKAVIDAFKGLLKP